MNQRSERNKELYQKVNQEIALKQKQEAEEAQKIAKNKEKLETIDPNFFGNEDNLPQTKEMPKQNNKNLIILTALITFVILVLIIIIAVVTSL